MNKVLLKNIGGLSVWLLLSTFYFGCSQEDQNSQNQEKQLTLSQLLQEEEFWEGNALEYKERFFTNDDGIFYKTESENPFSGVIKVMFQKRNDRILEQLYGGFDAWRFLRMA